MTRDSGDLDSACAEVNEDEHVLPHSAQHRPGVDGQEVGREMEGLESAAGAASSAEDGEPATRGAVLAGSDSDDGARQGRSRSRRTDVDGSALAFVAVHIQRAAANAFGGRRRDPVRSGSHGGTAGSRARKIRTEGGRLSLEILNRSSCFCYAASSSSRVSDGT
jgi:hypothetical protein